METHQKLLKSIIDQIEASTGKFNSAMPAIEREIFDKLLTLARDLEIKDGKLLNTVKNINTISKIKSEINAIILTDKYIDKVTEMTKAYNIISQLQHGYFTSLVADFKPKKVLSAIRNDAVKYTADMLTKAGLDANVSQGIENILRTSVTTGGSYAKLTEQLRNYITTTKTEDGKQSLGALERYTRQITVDGLNNFSAAYNFAISVDLGFEWFQYDGSLLETSREWCVHMVAKRFVHKSELQTIISNHIDGVKIGSSEIPISRKTGLPRGMKEGTDKSNILQNRGGWQCGHQFGGVPSVLVPMNLRMKFEKIAV